ncbi:MAG: hypothetical protein ISS38_04190 [Candidatus Cloacimonetes bacterium]|nr:hypothetical protein [Candidatus Cloacimonadota bacterium]
MTNSDWDVLLNAENQNEKLSKLNGHFVSVVFKNKNIIIRNDQLCLRDMFITETKESIIFSTRLDLVVKLLKNPEIDFNLFGTHWQLLYPLRKNCFVKNVYRLGPNGTARINSKTFTISNKSWLPESTPNVSSANLVDLLKEFTLLPQTFSTLTLALSGGMDSRTLLSYLINNNSKNWNTVTWHDDSHSDVIVAKKIIQKFDIQHLLLHKELPGTDECIKEYTKFVLETLSASAAHNFHELTYYKYINKNNFFIDGGAGALLRRMIGNKLLFYGKKAILNTNINELYQHLRIPKPDIFDHEINNILRKGCLSEIGKEFEKIPNPKKIGVENWIDLFHIRNKYPNHGAPAQARLDGFFQNYMPFAQPILLKRIFDIPARKRKNNKINKTILKNNAKQLLKIPLDKYGAVIPFHTNFYVSFIKAKIKNKFSKPSQNDAPHKFLNIISDYVQDSVRSNEVKNYSPYNYSEIRKLVDRYFSGETHLATFVNWWLTFDVWRKLIQ